MHISPLLGQNSIEDEPQRPYWNLINQLKNIRVFDAGYNSENVLADIIEAKGVAYPPRYIYWRAFKHERELEFWAKDSIHHPYTLIKTYPIYTICGDLGPKRKQGDMQVPEGFYKITRFNSLSSFWLSFKINYPNASDSILGYKKSLGGDIYIHGDTITIGCLPMTDSLIKEIYWISLRNKNELDSNETIPFHIFPIRLNKENWKYLYSEYAGDKNKIYFWNTLQGTYNYFEDSKTLPEITVDDKGYYKVVYPKKGNIQQNSTNGKDGLFDSRTGKSGG
jgi:murein L,D-transpeptidase YafK